MPQFRCYCVDRRCVDQFPVPDRPDNLVFPLSLEKSVGQGAANLPDDTRKVQQALNRIQAEQGGPTPSLSVDGIVGPKTRAAISRFQSQQLGFSDARVDPGGKTLAKLNQLIGGGQATQPTARSFAPTRAPLANPPDSFSVTDDNMKRVYLEFMPAAHSCAFAAVRLLQTPSSDKARSLLNKYFKLSGNPAATRDLDLIKRTFGKVQRLLARNAALVEKTFIPMPGVFKLADLATSGVLAVTKQNGAAFKGQKARVTMRDKSVFFVEKDKIWIQVTYFFGTTDLQIGTLVHEIAHYVGDSEGAPDAIDDPPGQRSRREDIDKLSPAQRPRIAECYSLFAFEAHFGRELSGGLLDLNPF
ncbi:peptidoglycan-binding protein [Bradyrhizobium lablabi]|uniref:peptidoglycan-binding domain-containing protein n=1 Tax=Bradyrhizobium lablabi TaxID=722472 RepID=UPI001BAB9256|nr:peptidoglycan-binding domain-containing protein [Bradyrhizobium lablabi]MBR0694724.1 hypothetical protein [Bradyrhizobium lablabi]